MVSIRKIEKKNKSNAWRLFPLQRFKFIQSARPVGAQEARETAVGEYFATSLTARAIVGFVVGVADALDLLATARTRLIEFAVHSEVGTERSHALGKGPCGFVAEAIHPQRECGARDCEEALPLFRLELVG